MTGPSFSAREGLDLAAAAARAWESDASLVYLENDEPLDVQGRAPRWSYLFHSATRDEGRVYSIRDGAIVVAVDLDFVFESPPVTGTWVDSDVALAAADEGGGAEYRRKFGGAPSTLLLMRGEVRGSGPDLPAWTVVYISSKAPSLYVLVDARTGEVRRTWS